MAVPFKLKVEGNEWCLGQKDELNYPFFQCSGIYMGCCGYPYYGGCAIRALESYIMRYGRTDLGLRSHYYYYRGASHGMKYRIGKASL